MKRNRHKLLLLGLMLFFCLFFGCSGQRQPYTVDMIVRFTDTGFWQSTYEGAKAAASQYGAQVNLYGPTLKGNENDQVEIFMQSIERHPDAIILGARDYDLLAEPVGQAVQAGIPVFLIDSEINSDQWLSLIATDNAAAGEQLAQELIARLGKQSAGKIGIVNFSDVAQNAKTREAGLRKGLQGKPQMQVLESIYVEANLELTEEKTLQLLQENPELVAIAGLNATVAKGVGRALKKAGREDIVFAGIDCTAEMAKDIEEGVLDVAITQQPYLMGYYSMDAAIKHLHGERVNRVIYTETYVVNQENLFTKESQQIIFPFRPASSQ